MEIKLLSKYIGNFGKFQALCFLLLLVPVAISGIHTTLLTFTAAAPSHRCRLAKSDDVLFNLSASGSYLNRISKNISFASLYVSTSTKNYCHFCPRNLNSTLVNETCKKNESLRCDKGFVVDRSIFRSTIVEDFEMLCAIWKKQLLQSSFMLGLIISCLLCGTLSDFYGRKPVFAVSCIAQIITLAVVPVVNHYWLLCILETINGIFTYSCYLIGFIIVMEMIGDLARTICGPIIQIYFSIGYMTMGLIAFYQRDWKILHWICSSLSVLLIPIVVIMPESVLWMTMHNRHKKALTTVKSIAKFNGKEIDEEQLTVDVAMFAHSEKKANMITVFKYPILARNSLILFYNWFTVSLVYYGLTLSADVLPGSLYVNFEISGASEIVGILIAILMMHMLGRRLTTSILLAVGGVSCFACGFVPDDFSIIRVLMAMIGKLGISGAFAVLYNYSAEIFPTVVRNAGTGTSSACARVGGTVAPQIILLVQFCNRFRIGFYATNAYFPMIILKGTYTHTSVPNIIYGVVALVGAVLVLLLPETNGQAMTNTIEEALIFCEKQKGNIAFWRSSETKSEITRL